jgi:putative ABC transport system ATP-binding protein
LSLLINLDNITKTYITSSSEFRAIKGVNFQLHAGEMVAIMGSSGSGKSTLMNIMGFLDHCTTGRYFFSGRDVSRLNDDELASIRNQKVGFVFQSFFLLPRLNALQNVMLPLFYRGADEIYAKEQSLKMLAKVGMRNFVDHKPNQLSGGQQQRVAIARALVGDPEVIFADEPTGSLDSKTSHDVMQLLIDLNQQEKRSIVIITHDKEVSGLCQRVVVLKDGCVDRSGALA